MILEPPAHDDPLIPLMVRLAPLRTKLLRHPIYSAVNDLDAVRVFMRSHVFAVWDFMCLVKRLQRDLTWTADAPWLPPLDDVVANLINDIVTGEESDEVEPGRFISHYRLYLKAMDDVGADATPMLALERGLRDGRAAAEVLPELPVLPATRTFVLGTLELARRPLPEVASAFLFGREDVIPAMFQHLLDRMDAQRPIKQRVRDLATRWRRGLPVEVRERVPSRVRRLLRSTEQHDTYSDFRLYLERHIEVDSGHHAPMGRHMLRVICGDDDGKWQAACVAAERAIEARIALWDGVLEDLRSQG